MTERKGRQRADVCGGIGARALLAAVAVTCAATGCQSRPEELSYYGDLPSWSFTTEQGRAVSDVTLRGTPWAANFLFTSCPTSCPPLAQASADLQRRLATWRSAGGPRIVSFTVDPVTDTPEVLRTYARRYGADPAIWSFARADYEATDALVTRGFLQPLLRSDRKAGTPLAAISAKPTPFDTAHSLRFVVVDGRGRLRAMYDKDEASLERLDAGLRWLTEHGDGP